MKMVEFVKENCQDKPTVYYYYHYFFLKLITIKKKKEKKEKKKRAPTNQALGVDGVVSRRMLTEIPAKNMKICRYTVQSTTKSRE